MKRILIALAIALVPAGWSAKALAGRDGSDARQALASRTAEVDAVFGRYNTSTPGCAVGVATNGTPVLAKGYGSADLEHDVPIAANTIFEAGSVSKQFTAAAVLLLARDGKLSIDDPVRKYIPELPDYPPPLDGAPAGSGEASPKPQAAKAGGRPLLIRHMLNHTSGLRDWGSVASIAGWPRTTRAHTHAHVLDIVSRQRSLNFPPGARWSYSNTGFNLAAIIVSRVSGMPFADFTRERLFKPVGMTDTSWRDDFTRVVKRRAIAYREQGGTFHTDMPFEDVHGNGGLLTTVGDLLKWNENFVKPVVGDAAFVQLQQEPGRFSDGRAHGYAFGLFVGTHGGLREVYHSGSTAGYSAFLTRFPDEKVSVAVLCNVATNATTLARAVADIYLAGRIKPAAAAPTFALTAADMERVAGLYRDVGRGMVAVIVRDGNGVRIEGGPRLTAVAPLRFAEANGDRWEFDGNAHAKAVDVYGTVDELERVPRVSPSPSELRAYEGTYTSADAEVDLTAKVEGDKLVFKRRPDVTIALTPLHQDAFRGGSLGTIVFRRDAGGRPVEFSVVQERVWNMPFRRIAAAAPTSDGRIQ